MLFHQLFNHMSAGIETFQFILERWICQGAHKLGLTYTLHNRRNNHDAWGLGVLNNLYFHQSLAVDENHLEMCKKKLLWLR